MRVFIAPADQTACGHVRARWPAKALIKQGADVHILEADQRNQLGAITQGGHVVSVMAPECDVLCIQRPTSQFLVESIPFLRAKGLAVCCDFDDDLSSVNPTNPAFHSMHPQRNPRNNWRWGEEAARLATLVTVSTPSLAAKYGAHGRVRVLRNCVPDHYLDVTADEKYDGFGWAGSLHSHPDDLQVLGPAAAKLVRAGHEFRVIGPPEGVGRALGLPADPEGTGVVPFDEWPAAMARLSIGIAPLADSRFNKAKSNYKLLEYLGAGVPFVASASWEYSRLAHLGAVVTRPREWERELGRLLTSPGLRADRAGAGREAAKDMTYSQNAHWWAEAWSDAIDLQRATVVV